MKQLLRFLPLLAILLFAGCANTETSASKKKSPQTPNTNTGNTQFTAITNAVPPTDTAVSDTNSVSTNASATPPNPFATPTPLPLAAPRDLPYGTPVPGRPGLVVNPYAPSNVPEQDKWLDVKGMPPGSEAKDPVSGKIFLVP